MRRAAAALLLVGLAAGCARYPVVPPLARPDLYVLLPGAGGAVGALVVSSEGQERTLEAAHAAVRVSRPGAIETATPSEAETRAIFGAALAAQPPRPVSYQLYFLLDSDELTPESREAMARMLGEIAGRPAPEVLVIGHTDTMGTDEYNDRLSLQRAERVRALLVERGLATGSIETSGRGKRELLVPTADQVEEARNRRVEIVVR